MVSYYWLRDKSRFVVTGSYRKGNHAYHQEAVLSSRSGYPCYCWRAFVAATPAHAASGYVTCATSNVVGVWVDVDGGTDGWAYRSGSGNTNYYSYNTQGKRWRVNVGCGGTPQNWSQSISSNWSNLQNRATITCADAGYIRTCRIG